MFKVQRIYIIESKEKCHLKGLNMGYYDDDFDNLIYRDLENVLKKHFYNNFVLQFENQEYNSIDFIFVLWDRFKTYKYYFTRKNNNDTWLGVCELIQKLIKDNLSFKGLEKIN